MTKGDNITFLNVTMCSAVLSTIEHSLQSPSSRYKISSENGVNPKPWYSTYTQTRLEDIRKLVMQIEGMKVQVQDTNSGDDRRVTILYYTILTAWCRVLLEKPTGLQLVKKFPAFHGTRRFITALTSVRHLSLSWASSIQSIYQHTISWRSILILSTYLRLGFPIGLFPSDFPTKTLYTPLSSPIRAT